MHISFFIKTNNSMLKYYLNDHKNDIVQDVPG